MPDAVQFEQGAVRIDAGVREGDAISPYYDPMIAKLIVHGDDRAQALARMAQALASFEVVGPATNVAFLGRLITSQPFATAELDTGLIERHHAALFPPSGEPSLAALALAVARLAMPEQVSNDPWDAPGGWRLSGGYLRNLRFACDGAELDVALAYRRNGWQLMQGGRQALVSDVQLAGSEVTLALDGARVQGRVVRAGDSFHVFHAGRHRVFDWSDPIAHAGEHESEGGRLTAPMPGKIVQLLVGAGAAVEKGAPLLIMEAMKMEHTISAPAKGRVAELLYAVGDQVAEGAQLLSFTPEEG